MKSVYMIPYSTLSQLHMDNFILILFSSGNSFLNYAYDGHRLGCTWFLKIVSVQTSAYVFVCVPAPKAINN